MGNLVVEILVIILVTLITVGISLSGGILMLSGSKLAKLFEKISLPFAVLILIYAACFDILPEVFEEEALPVWAVFTLVVVGIVACAFIRLIAGHWHRHGDEHTLAGKPQALAMLIVDTLHTAADGVVLGLAFSANLGTGILTAVATAAHEIPQELGDFSIMQRSKLPKSRIIKLQVLSGLVLIPVTILAYFIGDFLEQFMPVILSLIAGNLLYIALGELVTFIKLLRKGEKA